MLRKMARYALMLRNAIALYVQSVQFTCVWDEGDRTMYCHIYDHLS
jgi:hypothetical protein